MTTRVRTAAMLLLVCACASAPTTHSDEGGGAAPSKHEVIREYLEVSGSLDLGEQLARTLMAQMRPMFPDVPEETWAELQGSFDPRDPELVEMMVDVFDRHFTLEEVEALRDFYATPVGQSIVAKMPAAMQESMAGGQQWGWNLAQDLIERLRAQGHEPVEL
ncbi:MAG: DUF2059 domain-containing protein [Myxococcota bacterium]